MDKWKLIETAASLFEVDEMPDRFDGDEYARGVTDVVTHAIGFTSDEMQTTWEMIRAVAHHMSRVAHYGGN